MFDIEFKSYKTKIKGSKRETMLGVYWKVRDFIKILWNSIKRFKPGNNFWNSLKGSRSY